MIFYITQIRGEKKLDENYIGNVCTTHVNT